jgi:hypothetical protein
VTKACDRINLDVVSLEDINKILSECVVFKLMAHRPLKFWTVELKNAVKLQNKARKCLAEPEGKMRTREAHTKNTERQ